MMKFRRRQIKTLERQFTRIAFDLFRGGRLTGSKVVRDRRIRAWTGCSLRVIAKVWYLLERGRDLPELATKERLLWALYLMKSYPTEEVAAAACGAVDEGTFREWAWFFIEEISYLADEVVSGRLLKKPVRVFFLELSAAHSCFLQVSLFLLVSFCGLH